MPDSAGRFSSEGTINATDNLDKAVQLDRLVVKVLFGDGTFDLIALDSVKGAVLQPGAARDLDASLDTSKRPTGADIDTLEYHANGEPRCVAKFQA